MLPTDVLEDATLQAGAYPQRHGDRLGAQLGLTTRQGSRVGVQLRGTVSGTSASVMGEGPIGGARRGSWLIAARQSLLEWPVKRRNPVDGTVFGFADAYAKLVYDIHDRQQITVTALGGRSAIDGQDDRPASELANGTSRAGLLNVGWRAIVQSRLVLTQQAHVLAHQFVNKHQTGQDAATGLSRALSYRADAVHTVFGGLLEAGWQIQKAQAVRQWPQYGESPPGSLFLDSIDGFAGATWLRSGYVNFQWQAGPRLTITPGIRITDSTLVKQRAVGRWMLGAWSFRPDWILNASAGVSHQFPELEQLLGPGGSRDLRPERAVHADIGIARRLGDSFRWQVTAFHRRERDNLRTPLATAPVAASSLVQAERYDNTLAGHSYGVELLLERRRALGLSGWIAYSYGKSRQTDSVRNETFWADFDQRHALNVSGLYAPSHRVSISATFRGGTNFPIPGYLIERNGTLYVGGSRNGERLPAYARLDLRAQRSFDYIGRRFTLFVEVLNVFDRTNVGIAGSFIRRSTGEAAGLTEPLLPRLPSAGIRIDF
jgi:outer membrane cobalamin receptor